MPIPSSSDGQAKEAPSQHWLRDPLSWEVQQERWRHADALYSYGEYTMFVLLWTAKDLEQGRVTRCSRCFVPWGDIADTYKQPSQNLCPNCLGTTFEGGYRAKIIRPAIWDIGAETLSEQRHGVYYSNTAQVQSTSDFRFNIGDFAFRGDGSRWQVKSLGVSRLHSGFSTTADAANNIAYNSGQLGSEDENASVSYTVEPTDPEQLKAILDRGAGYRSPEDFSLLDELRPRASLL